MDIYSVFKSIAFKQDPEFIHDLALKFAHHTPSSAKLFAQEITKDLSLSVNNLTWKTPIGLAAGFDKNAYCIDFFDNLGFGAIEVGTITKLAQKGNPKPRIFRHENIKSIQNAMGFPNKGSQVIFDNLIKRNSKLCIGSNIGKNKRTETDKTPKEYASLYERFAPVSDYITINISSPNTPGLRSFQKKELLSPILKAIHEERRKCSKPTFIKIAPDLELEEVKLICELSKEYLFSGIIATNTTTQHEFGKGGLSGDFIKPIAQKLRFQVCDILRETPNQTIIGVGGISTYQEIKDFWKAGGSFVQIYSALIYQGPQLLNSIYSEMCKDIQKNELNNLQDLYQNIKEID
jgi:dihydroorotate dehydrogenase